MAEKHINPYEKLPAYQFWKHGVVEETPFDLKNIYTKKFNIHKHWNIATAGSCFAQHIAKHLQNGGYKILDTEPAPLLLNEKNHSKYGYSMYSARYGNIYTVQQLLQLTKEVTSNITPEDGIWTKNGRYYDAFRPSVEPSGLNSENEVKTHRAYHLESVKKVFETMDLFIFTLGLTETWINKNSGTVFPTAPGVLAGEFDPDKYSFKNYSFYECINAFNEFQDLLKTIRKGKNLPRIILTVSPVPLTATASGNHILKANSYSKSTLRAVAGHLSEVQSHIDYFPSYEIITNPSIRSMFYETNLRSVRKEGVETVMKVFSSEHSPLTNVKKVSANSPERSNNIQCEDDLLEVFS
ncbi:GSCFA domain-containing protein [Aliiglaciecola sp. NS0011-25]|uniref:GSCFA domain-containing protein n=1 Tax=Aliiglaciecola sp. NS0011-25 TaxID=3127654 RepID=UPI003104B3BF